MFLLFSGNDHSQFDVGGSLSSGESKEEVNEMTFSLHFVCSTQYGELVCLLNGLFYLRHF